jgi:soluble P-type ATPase
MAKGVKEDEEREETLEDILHQLTIPIEDLFMMLDGSEDEEKISASKVGFCILRDIDEHIRKLMAAVEKDLGEIKINYVVLPSSLHPRYEKARIVRK